MKPRIERVAVDALCVHLGDSIDADLLPWLQAADQALRQRFGACLIDLVPAYTTLLLHYDLMQLSDNQARAWIDQALHALQPISASAGKQHELPVWYDPSVGPDLAQTAGHLGCSQSELIRLHSRPVYQVYALGFAPGFAYLGLLDPALALPRLATPRQQVPAGSVAIAERQTAIYPLPSPGGWHLLGRMPLPLFDPHTAPYSLLQPGDQVKMVPVERDEFIRLGGDPTPCGETA
ncbi:5-oxoprolinase subunit PxpB [Halopseudomonas salegens]|uniref:Sensor histidine kinase inhibitor, KipI family n=1 Tax=Halopseudomonas salegens TaxID=1434072 RepID=A0A1H2HKE1_9GAMM|nr:5-oxoprolinase subunit PxpB [Halopseudomonas salegens]SDU32315.1 sensor histidine kinase inhibitor, KipI family [Halopseudomonas salegens]